MSGALVDISKQRLMSIFGIVFMDPLYDSHIGTRSYRVSTGVQVLVPGVSNFLFPNGLVDHLFVLMDTDVLHRVLFNS